MRAGEVIGRQDAAARERRAVGAAAHRDHLRRDAVGGKGAKDQIDGAPISPMALLMLL